MLSIEKKQQISQMLRDYCSAAGSVDKAADKLINVSPRTVHSIISEKYQYISDAMFRNIRKQISPKDDGVLVPVETRAVKDILFCMEDVHRTNDCTWIIAKAGGSKSLSAKLYKQNHSNVFYIECDADMRKLDFALALAKAVGLRLNTQKKARDIIMEVVDEIGELDDALIIFDECDKLTDNILYYFISIYNLLADKAGIVFLSTDYMVKRMEQGLKYNKRGFQELFSRIARRFYMAEENDANDVYAVCLANDIKDKSAIAGIIKDVEGHGYDFRRLKKKIKAVKGQRRLVIANQPAPES